MKSEIRLIAFTQGGNELLGRIARDLEEYTPRIYEKEDYLQDFCKEAFERKIPLVFIGATGIAVRTIAPLIKDKLSDPPIVVMDERGHFAIPLISGHYGGANELAVRLGEITGATPVITTATDINYAFSVDSFARENELKVVNKDGIKKVSTKALEGKPITISIKNYPPEESVDVIVSDGGDGSATLGLEGNLTQLIKKGIVLGLGCKKGKTKEEIKTFAEECLKEMGLSFDDISAVATIDIKEKEEGIVELIKELSLPLITFDSEILRRVKGDFSSSSFVQERTGVDNVCERAAMAATGGRGTIIKKKTARNGITIALVDII